MSESQERDRGQRVARRWLVAAIAGVSLSSAGGQMAHAATYYYDANTATAGTGGTGSWNTSSLVNWRAGAVDGTLSKWPGSTPAGTGPALDTSAVAVFGDVAGNVTLGAAVAPVVNRIVFETTGYQLRPNTTAVLNFSGTSPTVHSDVALATIRAPYANGFEKTGTGTLVLDYFSASAASTFTGGTVTLTGGMIRSGSQYSFGTQAARANLVFNGGTLDLNGFTGVGTPGSVATGEITYIGALSGAAGTVRNDGAIGATLKVGVGSNSATTFSGVIQNGSQTTKLLIGDGTSTPALTLTGANTYTGGTEIQSGSLLLDGGGSIVAANTTITGGSLAGVAGGTDGTLNFRIVNDLSDLISLSGTGSLALSNLTLNLVLSGTQTLPEYVLANKAVGSGFINGAAFGVESLPSGWAIDYDGTVANPGSIVLIAPVPEPTGMAAVALGLGGILMRRRRSGTRR